MRNPCALYGDVRANLRSDRLRRPGCCYLSPSLEGAGRVKARRGIVQVLPCGRGCASSRAPDRPLSSRYGEPELPVDSPGRRAPRGLSSIASDRFSVRDLAPSKVPDPPVSPRRQCSTEFVSPPGPGLGLTCLRGHMRSRHSAATPADALASGSSVDFGPPSRQEHEQFPSGARGVGKGISGSDSGNLASP